MRVVLNIRYFTRSEYAHEYPICTRLMQGMKDNWRLVLAALFHDIGKGLGGHHEKAGAKILQAFCERFGIDQETTDYLVFLVREHLTMSLVAQKQDLSDPDVIKRFAQIVQTEDRLNGLFLLTVCDIRATGPKVWNGRANCFKTSIGKPYRLSAKAVPQTENRFCFKDKKKPVK